MTLPQSKPTISWPESKSIAADLIKALRIKYSAEEIRLVIRAMGRQFQKERKR